MGRLSRRGQNRDQARDLQFISDPSAEIAALLAGDVDAFPRFAGYRTSRSSRAIRASRSLIGGTEGKTILAINNKKKPLDDLRVRQAIAYAIDRKAIIDGAHERPRRRRSAATSTPNDPGYVDLTGAYPHDPAKAKALLKEAGVTTPLKLTLTLPPPDYARKGGEIIAAELAEVGIQAKIENVEWAQWLSNVYKDHNFDLTIISHVEPLDIGIYANPDYYFQYDSQAFRDDLRAARARRRISTLTRQAIGDAQRQDRRRLRQRLPVPVARTSSSPTPSCKGLWKNAPIFVNDLSARVVEAR